MEINFLFLEGTAKWRKYTKNKPFQIVVRAMEKLNRMLWWKLMYVCVCVCMSAHVCAQVCDLL